MKKFWIYGIIFTIILSGCARNVENDISPIYILALKSANDTNALANYTVEHWQQNARDDNYTRIDSDTVILQGASGTLTTATENSYSDFNLKNPIEQKIITADGSTVVKVFYDRKTSTYTFDANGGHWNDNTITKEYIYRYGQLQCSDDIMIPETPSRTGFSFNGWNPSVFLPDDNGRNNMTFIAQWTED